MPAAAHPNDQYPTIPLSVKWQNGGVGNDRGAARLTKNSNTGEGGLVGPDLSSLANRFSPGDIFESISEPSKTINQFYQSSEIILKDGAAVVGQVIEETPTELKVMADPYNPTSLTVVKVAAIESRKHSAISQMPPMLVSMFNKGELLDFMAYVLSSGDPRHAYFKK